MNRLLLEELIGGGALRLFLDLVCLQPRDLFLQKRDALVELLHGEQGQILPNLVGELFLRTVFVIDRWHGEKIPRAPPVVTCARADYAGGRQTRIAR